MPRVYNKRTGYPPGAVYVGRPSKFGNPYTHLATLAGRRGLTLVPSRRAAIEAYRHYLERTPWLKRAVRVELRGKDLVCWCAPSFCHADVLLEIANGGGGQGT